MVFVNIRLVEVTLAHFQTQSPLKHNPLIPFVNNLDFSTILGSLIEVIVHLYRTIIHFECGRTSSGGAPFFMLRCLRVWDNMLYYS